VQRHFCERFSSSASYLLFAKRGKTAKIAFPNLAQHNFAADECAKWSAEKPREDEFFFPLKKSLGAVGDWFEREDARASDDADVLDAHCFTWHPLSDFHFVGQTNRADFCVAEKRRADSAGLVRDEANCDGVVHPINMPFDRLNNLPNLFRAGVNFNRNFDNAHRLVSVVSL